MADPVSDPPAGPAPAVRAAATADHAAEGGHTGMVTLAVDELLLLCRRTGLTLPPSARFSPVTTDPGLLALAESVAARCLLARGLVVAADGHESVAPDEAAALAVLDGWQTAVDVVVERGREVTHTTVVTADGLGASLAVRPPGLADLRWFPSSALVTEALTTLPVHRSGEGHWELPRAVAEQYAAEFAAGDDSMLLMGLMRQHMPGRQAARLLDVLRGRTGYGVLTVYHRDAPAAVAGEWLWVDTPVGRYAVVPGMTDGEPVAVVQPFVHDALVRFLGALRAPAPRDVPAAPEPWTWPAPDTGVGTG